MEARDDLVQIEVEVDTIESFTSSEDEELFIQKSELMLKGDEDGEDLFGHKVKNPPHAGRGLLRQRTSLLA